MGNAGVGDRLTPDEVRTIIDILDASQFDELKLETGDFKLSLRRSSAPAWETAPAPPPPAISTISTRPAAAASDLTPIKAPLLGIFYRAPKPGAPPFVEVGRRVEPGTVVGIVEVMKLMNSIHSEVAGEVVEILAADGAMVEFDQILLNVRQS